MEWATAPFPVFFGREKDLPGPKEWYPQRVGLTTDAGLVLFTGWSAVGPLISEDQCQTNHP